MSSLLIIDDDPDLLALLSAHYGAGGHRVAIASNCADGLRMAAADKPDAVLLDFCMPKMDGARFIEVLRADKQTTGTPVIVMSAANSNWVSQRLQPDPLVRIVDKPFEFSKIDPLIEQLIAAGRA
jgi:CheY-like chemotaxis protein